jgi:hypothetical protein
MLNRLPTELCALLTSVSPDQRTPGTVTSAWVNVAPWHGLLAVVGAGVIASGGELVASLLQAKDAAGTGAKAMPAKVTGDITAQDRQRLIQLSAAELDINNGFGWVALRLVTASANVWSAAHVLGVVPRGDTSGLQAATVVEVIG